MKYLIEYAIMHCNIPYRWGGDDPFAGYDCSGFLQEVLSSVGLDPRGDQTANSLYIHFKKNGESDRLQAGSLCFFGTIYNITHCAFAIDGFRMVEAGGGGRKTTTREAAQRQNAFIRIRPIGSRKDLVAAIYPEYRHLQLNGLNTP